jgi:hypothetical protein
MASLPPLSAAAVEVERAIRVMYGEGGTSAPGAQQAALAWLVAFADSDAAWGVFPELVAGSASPAVQYYAANGVYTKVLRGWAALPPGRRAQVGGFLWSALGAGASSSSSATAAAALATPALRRLCLALASATAQSRAPSDVAAYLQRAVAPLGELVAANGGAGAPSACVALACLELLRCLPEAVADDATRGIGRRGADDAAAAVAAALRSSSDGVLRALQGVIADAGSPLRLAGASAVVTASSTVVHDCRAAALGAAQLWLALSLCGPGALLTRYGPLAAALLEAATSPSSTPVAAEAAADALAAAFDNASAAAARRRRGRGGIDGVDAAFLASLEEDEAEGRADATAAVATALIAAVPQLQAWAAAGNTARLLPAARLASLVTSLEPDVEWWAGRGAAAPVELPAGAPPVDLRRFPYVSACLDHGSGSGSAPPTIDGAPVGVGVLFADTLLQLAAVEGDPAVASSAAAGFYAVKFLPPPAVHPFLRWHAYAALVRVLTGQCLYPLPPTTTTTPAAAAQPGTRRVTDPHTVLAFRDGRHGSTLHEALGDCVAVLGCAGYLGAVTAWLRELQQQTAQPGASTRFTAPARALEAALLVTSSRAVAGPILDGLLRPPQSEDEAAAASAAEGAATSLLTALVAAAAAQPPDAHPELLATGCAWVGRVGSVWLREILAARGPTATVCGSAPGSAPVPVAPLLQQALQLIGACLQSPAAPLYAPKPRRDDLAALAAFTADAVSGSGSSAGLRALAGRSAGETGADGDASDDDDEGSEEGDGGGDDDGAGGDGEEATSAPLSTAGANALCELLPALATAGQQAVAPQLAAAVVSAFTAGALPAAPAARVLTALVRMVLVSLPPSQQTDELVAAVQAPLVALLRPPASAAAASRGGSAADALGLCRPVALAVALLAPLQQGRQPAATGARAQAAAERTPLDATADALWRACEAALAGAASLVAGTAAAVVGSVLLHGLTAVLQCCPAAALDGGGSRLQAALSLGVQLFTTGAHPGALSVATAAVALLPALAPAGSPPRVLPPALQAACSQLAAAVLPAAASAASAPPEVAEAACGLVLELLSVAPDAVVATPAHLAAALSLAAAGFATGDRGAARAAADVIAALVAASRGRVAAVHAALQHALPSLAHALLGTLLVGGDVGGPGACAAVVDTLHALFATAAAAGGGGTAPPWAAHLLQAVASALAQLASAAPASSAGGAPAPSDTATGLGCLAPGECAALVGAAGRLAAAGPRERRRFDVLWDDLRRLATRRGTRDALSAYGV